MSDTHTYGFTGSPKTGLDENGIPYPELGHAGPFYPDSSAIEGYATPSGPTNRTERMRTAPADSAQELYIDSQIDFHKQEAQRYLEESQYWQQRCKTSESNSKAWKKRALDAEDGLINTHVANAIEMSEYDDSSYWKARAEKAEEELEEVKRLSGMSNEEYLQHIRDKGDALYWQARAEAYENAQ